MHLTNVEIHLATVIMKDSKRSNALCHPLHIMCAIPAGDPQENKQSVLDRTCFAITHTHSGVRHSLKDGDHGMDQIRTNAIAAQLTSALPAGSRFAGPCEYSKSSGSPSQIIFAAVMLPMLHQRW